MHYFKKTSLFLAMLASFSIHQPVFAQATDDNVSGFTTETGLCNQSSLDLLADAKNGSTYTLDHAEIFSADGINPAAVGEQIPSMTSLSCHAIGKNKDFVLVSKKSNPSFCGWVNKVNLLQSKAGAENKDIFGNPVNNNACNSVLPLKISEYCKAMQDLNETIEACQDKFISKSTINAKFMVWNADLSNEERKANALQVPIYTTKRANRQRGAVDLFSVLQIFDVAQSPEGVLYLVGSDFRNMYGWIRQDSGTVWFSKLATFYADNSKGTILSDEPSVDSAIEIAKPPKKLSEMLNSDASFQEYPVLFDRRAKKNTKDVQSFLEVAFIGRLCRENELCVDDGTGPKNDELDVFQSADILFLIDATKSMRRYFPLVSQAVRNVAGEEKSGSLKYRFGAAIYGDYLSKNKKNLKDPMQFKIVAPLKPLRRGNEMDKVGDVSLYIDDPAGGYSEAMFSALYNGITKTRWRRDNTPKFIIHLGDHGDRGNPPQELLDLMKAKQIFYLPIAVRGDYRPQESADFVSHTQSILNQHVTKNGNTIGIKQVLKTYKNNEEIISPETEYNSIANALRVSINLESQIRKLILNELLNLNETTDLSNQQVPGSSDITLAALDLYGIDIPKNGASIAERTLAAKGYIPVSGEGKEEKNWRFSVAIRPGDIRALQEGFSALCKYTFGSSSEEILLKNVTLLISKLTGDTIETADDFKRYFDDRDSIPLVSRTILGEGVLELATIFKDLSSADRVAALQKESCRTFSLLKQMEAGLKLRKPFDEKLVSGELVKGDMTWNDDEKIYTVKNSIEHNWIVKDKLGSSFIFIPLDYFPPKPSDIR